MDNIYVAHTHNLQVCALAIYLEGTSPAIDHCSAQKEMRTMFYLCAVEAKNWYTARDIVRKVYFVERGQLYDRSTRVQAKS